MIAFSDRGDPLAWQLAAHALLRDDASVITAWCRMRWDRCG
jgi:hypothetical protein